MSARRLTLFQRRVIQRLREAGFASVADGACGCWEHGGSCLFAVMLREAHPPGVSAELAAAFERANAQALGVWLR